MQETEKVRLGGRKGGCGRGLLCCGWWWCGKKGYEELEGGFSAAATPEARIGLLQIKMGNQLRNGRTMHGNTLGNNKGHDCKSRASRISERAGRFAGCENITTVRTTVNAQCLVSSCRKQGRLGRSPGYPWRPSSAMAADSPGLTCIAALELEQPPSAPTTWRFCVQTCRHVDMAAWWQ